MNDEGIGSWIERRARIAPDRIAVISGTDSWTYAALAQRIRRLAHGLASLGVQRGDRVCWVGSNHPAFLETLFATARLGAILAPVNHRLDPAEVRSVVADASPRVIVTEATSADQWIRSNEAARVLVVGSSGAGAVDFEGLVVSSTDGPIDETVSLSDVCMIPHTSGTTGPAKGVMLTHGNVTWNAVNILTSTDLRADDVTIAVAPFFRVGGTGVNVLPLLFRGGAVIVPTAPDPEGILSLIREHRVTVGFANPDLLDALTRTDSWGSCDLTSLRYFITGGASVPERLLRVFLERSIPCLQGYGLSEAAPFVLLLPPEHALDRLGSAGAPAMTVDVRVVRPDKTDCAPQETGELLVRGPNVMAGYWRLPDETSRTIDGEGWLHSGDAARVDDEGLIWIVDRLADGYDTAGGRVFPSDIDRVLLAHPGVADAASVGVPVGAGLAQTHSFVVPDAGQGTLPASDLIDFSSARLPAHAVPVSIEFIDSVPRSSVGKVLRHRLKVTSSEAGAPAPPP